MEIGIVETTGINWIPVDKFQLVPVVNWSQLIPVVNWYQLEVSVQLVPVRTNIPISILKPVHLTGISWYQFDQYINFHNETSSLNWNQLVPLPVALNWSSLDSLTGYQLEPVVTSSNQLRLPVVKLN